MHFHYAKSVPVSPIGYNVYNDKNEWCGVILYAYGANKNLGTQYNLPLGGGIGTSKSRFEWETRTDVQSPCIDDKMH